jgi:GTP-binding protein 1
MTTKATLRSFQDEIDNIHHKETLKQRAQAQVSTEREAAKKPVKLKDTTDGKDKDQPDIEEPAQGFHFDDDSELQVRQVLRANGWMVFIPVIQTWFGMNAAAAYDKARDAVAARLTRNKGEYIIRLGAHPSRANIFGIEGRETLDGPCGNPCTVSELQHMESVLLRIAGEIGAKVLIIVHWWSHSLIFRFSGINFVFPI